MITREQLTADEYDPYFQHYLGLVDPSIGILQVLEQSLFDSISFIEKIEKPLDFRYAPDKWTIAQVILHNIDTERVFAYRALRFMRNDSTALAGFDQDVFIDGCDDYAFAKAELLESLKATRLSTMSLFKNVPGNILSRKGTASGKVMSARVIPFLIAGHHKHHETVISERY